MKQKEIIRYSNSFKQQVVKELESGRFDTFGEAREHYGITGGRTLQLWVRKYGRNHLCPKIVRVQMPDEKDQIRELRKIAKICEKLPKIQRFSMTLDDFFRL